MPRDRTAFLLHCLEELEAGQAAATSTPAPSPASNTTTH